MPALRSRVRRFRFALLALAGAAALGVVLVLVLRGDIIEWFEAWRLGYRVRWAPAGVVPSYSRSHHLTGGVVAVEIRRGDPEPRAALWRPVTGELTFLAELSGAEPRSSASSITRSGFVMGTFYSGKNHLARGVLWSSDSEVVDLGSLGGSQIAPIDLNDRGDVVGWAGTGGPRHAFLWTRDGGLQDLGVEGYASAINERRRVAGTIESGLSSSRPSFVPFSWTPEGGVQRAPLPAGCIAGSAVDINDRGEVLVNFYRKVGINTSGLPYLWTPEAGELRPLSLPSEGANLRAAAMNDAGVILLAAGDPNESRGACLIRDGMLIDVPEIPGAERTHYETIDEEGRLLGRARFDGDWRGFVAEPFP